MFNFVELCRINVSESESGAVGQQAIMWTKVYPDPCRHMASLGIVLVAEITQHGLRWWLVVWRHQAITWTKVLPHFHLLKTWVQW